MRNPAPLEVIFVGLGITVHWLVLEDTKALLINMLFANNYINPAWQCLSKVLQSGWR